jgi:hypothetical protein
LIDCIAVKEKKKEAFSKPYLYNGQYQYSFVFCHWGDLGLRFGFLSFDTISLLISREQQLLFPSQK